MKPIEQQHGVSDVANLVVLGHGKGEVDQSPSDNSRTTVVKELEVKVLAETRVEFNAHEQVVDL